MNQREKLLAIGVAGLVAIIGLQWGLNKYNSAIESRNGQIESLIMDVDTAMQRQNRGVEASERMAHLVSRSLPSDSDKASSAYTSWLLELVTSARLTNADVRYVTSVPHEDLYRKYSFSVSGRGNLDNWIEMLHAFHRMDYLHRIRSMDVGPAREGGLSIKMSIEAVALSAAPANQEPPESPSPVVNADVAAYKEPILNRNFFSPPNQPPRFAADATVEAILDQPLSFVAQFDDPEGDAIRYSLEGEVPEGISIDEQSGRLEWKPEKKEKVELLVRASDQGWPSRTTEQRLAIEVVDPPVEEPKKPELAFDEAKQAVLTGLVGRQGEWIAWVNLRTKGEIVKLKAGDPFEIGSLKGTVMEVNERFAVLEVDDRRFTLKLDGNLATAAAASQVD